MFGWLTKKAKGKSGDLARSIKTRSTIKDPTSSAFSKTGAAAAGIIARELRSYLRHANPRILDFGCGSGRVALPLARNNPDFDLVCCDVDKESVEYLSFNLPKNGIAEVSDYRPPLKYGDNMFDAVYAVSVWSHFPEDLALEWLMEMRRVAKPGAVLLITTAGEHVLDHWRNTAAQWKNISYEDLEAQRFIYREYLNLNSQGEYYPGISGEGSWGNALVHPDYIRESWGRWFGVRKILEGGMNGMQDIVVLENTKS